MLKGERTRLQRYAIESTPARVYEGCCTWFTILVLSAEIVPLSLSLARYNSGIDVLY
jgi:hypothetical protein